MMEFARPRSRRRVSLTPMIDVVFQLITFFMLTLKSVVAEGDFAAGGSFVATVLIPKCPSKYEAAK